MISRFIYIDVCRDEGLSCSYCRRIDCSLLTDVYKVSIGGVMNGHKGIAWSACSLRSRLMRRVFAACGDAFCIRL